MPTKVKEFIFIARANVSKKTFIIDRSILRCGGTAGHGPGVTSLLNKEGFMCCLGQIGLQCGVPKEELLSKAEPRCISNEHGERIKFLLEYSRITTQNHNSVLAKEAMEINDYGISFRQRESRLKKLFDKYGYEIQFVGKYQKKHTHWRKIFATIKEKIKSIFGKRNE